MVRDILERLKRGEMSVTEAEQRIDYIIETKTTVYPQIDGLDFTVEVYRPHEVPFEENPLAGSALLRFGAEFEMDDNNRWRIQGNDRPSSFDPIYLSSDVVKIGVSGPASLSRQTLFGWKFEDVVIQTGVHGYKKKQRKRT